MTGATIPEGSVVITPTEMYREMLATHQAVRDVSGKLDGALDAHSRRLDGLDKDVLDHENRLRHAEQTGAAKEDVQKLEQAHGGRLSSVEKRLYAYTGGVGVLSLGGGWLITYLTTRH